LGKFLLYLFKNKIIFNSVIFVPTKKGRTKNPPFDAVVGSGMDKYQDSETNIPDPATLVLAQAQVSIG
jgi:hypothetical protein